MFFLIAVIIFMEVIGIFYGSYLFWIVFLIGYGFGIILLSFIFYFSNQLDNDNNEVDNVNKSTFLLTTNMTCLERDLQI